MGKDLFGMSGIRVAGAVADTLLNLGLVDQVERVRFSESLEFGNKIVGEAKKILQPNSSLVPSNPDDYLGKE